MTPAGIIKSWRNSVRRQPAMVANPEFTARVQAATCALIVLALAWNFRAAEQSAAWVLPAEEAIHDWSADEPFHASIGRLGAAHCRAGP